jgi:S-(hydroxymethyl)glutathione dehydrogenase/alcohol dehydrogenase
MPKSIGAIMHEYNKPLVIEEFDIGDPMPNEVLVRTVASGVCHSDLHNIEGHMPMGSPALLGHEAAGIVERVGSNVTYVQPGDHVIARGAFCGTCEECMMGNLHLCTTPPRRSESDPFRISLKGAMLHTTGSNISSFADKMLLHENGCVKIRKDVPLEVAALVGCAVITGVGAAISTAQVRPGTSVAVFGAGGIGLSVVQGARLAGAREIIAIDLLDSKLKTAEEFGATHTINSRNQDPVAAIRDITGGKGAHYAFDAIGVTKVVEQGLEALRPRGVMTMIGIIPQDQFAQIGFNSMRGEKRLQGCSMGSNRFRLDMPMILDMYKQGRLKLDEMVTRRGPIEDINDMFDVMKTGEVTRQVIMFDQN